MDDVVLSRLFQEFLAEAVVAPQRLTRDLLTPADTLLRVTMTRIDRKHVEFMVIREDDYLHHGDRHWVISQFHPHNRLGASIAGPSWICFRVSPRKA